MFSLLGMHSNQVSAIHAANETLPISPPTGEAEWTTDELCSLSKKKKETWIPLLNTQRADLKSEYQCLKKLTKVTADKARNAWWRVQVVEAEYHAWITEQTGCGGSLI